MEVVGEAAGPGTHNQGPPQVPVPQNLLHRGESPLVLALRLGRPAPVPIEVRQVVQGGRRLIRLPVNFRPGHPREPRLQDGADICQLTDDTLDHGPTALPGDWQQIRRLQLLVDVPDGSLHLLREPGYLPPARREVGQGIGKENGNGPQPRVDLPALPTFQLRCPQIHARGAPGTAGRVQQAARVAGRPGSHTSQHRFFGHGFLALS